ncbi:MAG: LTA synthase family protein [Crocinitomicaceae bacterium]|nr:LTA synthase family protein [Crocinitomicaceae bacterium]
MQLLKKTPVKIVNYGKQLGFVWLVMTLTRIFFHSFNQQAFTDVTPYDYLIGAWFDAVTIGLVFLPYAIVYLAPLPTNVQQHKIYKFFYTLLFIVTTLVVIALNLMDIEYFKYTSKRSTADLFSILTAGSDLKQLITTFITDFWFIILIFIALLFVTFKSYKWLNRSKNEEMPSILKQTIYYVVVLGCMIFIGRGGIVFKPVGVLDVARYVNSSKTALVLNTPFTMLKSIGNEELERVNYYSSIEETEKYFNPVQQSHPQHLLPSGTNVVILILESFGKEFIGTYNEGKSYTPFLDSLLSESLVFDAGFANGKKSIEAVPSIFASIPSLQDNPYISSQYNSNRIVGLPELLKRHGYESAFYHGATNGSMRFDAFADYIGFDHYIGRKEYNNEKHTDKTWGVLDEYFNPWTAKQIGKLKQPFLATLFTLSSHHPYFVPEHRKKEVIEGPQPLCASISYGDLSLRLFFEEAKKQPWYENTVFFICADHTPGTVTPLYNLQTQLYQIPMAIYHPGGKIEKGRSKKVFQQIDIYPTVLDLLNIEEKFYSFGNSYYSTTDRFSISYLEGNYFFAKNDKLLLFSKNQARNLYVFSVKENPLIDVFSENRQEVSQMEAKLKAIIQRYNRDLIENKTAVR